MTGMTGWKTEAIIRLHAAAGGIDVSPEKPPKADGILKILNWVDWGVFAVCLAGFLIAAGAMAIRHHQGASMQDMSGLAKAAIGTVLASAATAIVGVLMG